MTKESKDRGEFTKEDWIDLIDNNCVTDEDIEHIILNEQKLGQISIYVRLLQDGDPENENPKMILDYIDECLNTKGNDGK